MDIPTRTARPPADPRADLAGATVAIPQYSRPAILAVWAAATLPMAALSWLVAPAVAARLEGAGGVPIAKALIGTLAAGLVWQFVLVVILIGREQRTLRWSVVREALWLRPPRGPASGRVGGRLWLIVIPLMVGVAISGLLLPELPIPADRDLFAFLASDAGRSFLSGNWVWFAVIVVQLVFNTVLGEELLFRGFLLPRMNRAFGAPVDGSGGNIAADFSWSRSGSIELI